MSKVSVAEMFSVLGLSGEITNVLVRVQLRESEGIDDGFLASPTRQSPDIDPWKRGSRCTSSQSRLDNHQTVLEIVSRLSLERRRPRKMGACKNLTEEF